MQDELEYFLVNDQDFLTDGGSSFGVIPKVIWQKYCNCDNENKITVSNKVLYISYGNEKILIDLGHGNRLNDKAREIFGLKERSGVIEFLTNKEIQPEEITKIIFTHLHFDHINGLFDEKVELNLKFPNAKYYININEYEIIKRNNVRIKKSYPLELLFYFFENHKDKIIFINDKYSINEFISIEHSGGHTLGHQIVKLKLNNKLFYFMGDIIPATPFLNINCVSAYDQFPLETIEYKTNILQEINENNGYIIFQHDPVINCASIELEKEYVYKIKEIINI